MRETTEKYKELLDLIETWGVSRADLHRLARGYATLSDMGAQRWTEAACAFNRETHRIIHNEVKSYEGVKIILADSLPQLTESVVCRALMYTDLIVIYSGPPVYGSLDTLLTGVAKGGILCDGIIEWFLDLLTYRPLLVAGYGACIQKHYYDMYPDREGPRWILANLKYQGDRTARQQGADPAVHPYSLYADLMRPSSLDCVYSGSNFQEWKQKLVGTFKSIHEAAFGTLLKCDLPYLANIPLEVMVRIREEEPIAFPAFRNALKSAIQECMKFDVQAIELEEFAKHVQRTYLQPHQESLRAELQQIARKKHVRRFGPVIATTSLVFNVLTGNAIGMLIDSLSISHQGAQEILETQEGRKIEVNRANELYLLWRLQEVARKR